MQQLLNPTELDILATDRARLLQTTVANGVAFADALGLSEATKDEFTAAAVDRLRRMGPEHHHYVNDLLGAAATAMTGQIGYVQSERVRPTIAAVATPPETQRVSGETTVGPDSPVVTGSEEAEADDFRSRLGDLDRFIGTEHAGVSEQGDQDTSDLRTDTAAVTEPEVESLPYDPDDFIPTPVDRQFVVHKKRVRSAFDFAVKVFPDARDDIESLSPKELSLLAWQLIETFEAMKIPKVPKKSQTRRHQQMAVNFGLFGPAQSGLQLAEDFGISSQTFASAKTKIAEYLQPEVDGRFDELVRKARVTIEHGDPIIFTDEMPVAAPKIDQAREDAEDKTSELADPEHEVVVDADVQAIEAEEADVVLGGLGFDVDKKDDDKGDAEAKVDERSDNTGVEVEIDPELLQEYSFYVGEDGIGDAMSAFLGMVVNDGLQTELFDLAPYQQCWTMHQFLKKYAALENTGLTSDDQKMRVKMIEQFVGLYDKAITYAEIAENLDVESGQVTIGIRQTAEKLARTVAPHFVRDLLDKAYEVFGARTAALAASN